MDLDKHICLLTTTSTISFSQETLMVKDLPVNAGYISDTGSIPGEGKATHSSILA